MRNHALNFKQASFYLFILNSIFSEKLFVALVGGIWRVRIKYLFLCRCPRIFPFKNMTCPTWMNAKIFPWILQLCVFSINYSTTALRMVNNEYELLIDIDTVFIMCARLWFIGVLLMFLINNCACKARRVWQIWSILRKSFILWLIWIFHWSYSSNIYNWLQSIFKRLPQIELSSRCRFVFCV